MIAAEMVELAVQYWPISLLSGLLFFLIYNKYYHGLHIYPGPRLAAYTNWWRFYDAAQRSSQVTMINLHKKHGDVVRLGPNVLSFADPAAVKEIYGLNKGYTKTAFYPIQSSIQGGKRLYSLFSTRDEAYHSRFRRCVASAYAMGTLVEYEPLVDSTITEYIRQTEQRFADVGAGCNFSRWLQYFAFDVIGEITWSKRLGFVERNEDVEGVIDTIARFVEYANVVGQMPWLDSWLLAKNPVTLLLSRFGIWGKASPLALFGQARMAERQLESADAKQKRESAHTGVDFLTRFYQSQRAHPDFMTDRQILTASISLITAGSDTTAASLSAVFFFLLRNPPVLRALLNELAAAAASGVLRPAARGPVSWAEAQRLPYLDACIQEALRLHPAIGMLLERHVPPSGATIAGRKVPGGTIVGCNPWVLHRRTEIFGEDVEAFRPERWLEAGPEQLKTMKGAMLQFGAGPRTCIGKNISLLEMYKLVPTLLRRFEIVLVDPKREWTLINCWFVRQENFHVRFEVREETSSGHTNE